ncbi:threonine-phosphate decarboxylase CobD [Halovivax limisalsi]|uniref:threonine-phosphate decarboxylase CobD n=1 Tax=Halovivax limisalsi TaxID=1453760 RepID=UPI001FFCD957|nr:threonine-phosphate decarboxylase CobD [Halovivax limisalsi]
MDPASVRETDRVPHGGTSDPSVLDCSANVNPETPDGVDGVYREALEEARRYPDDSYADFRAAAASYVGCDPGDVIPTAGGLAAIRLALEVSVQPGDEVLVPAPSFGEYAREVRLQGASPRFVPHDELTAADPGDAALAVACTPNNPTGETIEPAELADFARRCEAAGTALLVDEAFLGFTGVESMAERDRANVVVARSLTKLFGLPGLRAGFAVASGDLGDALERARPTWSLGTPAARVGAHCMRDEAFVAETRDRVRRERRRLRNGLERAGFAVFQSDAPFLLVEPLDRDASTVLEDASEAGIALRDARTFRGLDDHVRIAVRDRETTDRVLEGLADA